MNSGCAPSNVLDFKHMDMGFGPTKLAHTRNVAEVRKTQIVLNKSPVYPLGRECHFWLEGIASVVIFLKLMLAKLLLVGHRK